MLATAGCLVATTTFRVHDTDFWQHLTVGREILATGRVPTTQIWTWPRYGQPDVTPSWAFAALLEGFWKAGAMRGLFVWRWLTTLAAFAFAWLAARRLSARGFSALVVVGWAALAYRLRAEPRPETLASVLLAAQLWMQETVRTSKSARPWRSGVMILPAIALLWANVHVSYWMGIALQALYAAECGWRARRAPERRAFVAPQFAMLATSVMVSFLNPGGWQALAQPFQYWFVWRHELIYRQIGELMPLEWGQNLRNLLPLLVAGWPALLLLRARRHGWDAIEIVIAATALGLGLSSQRFLGFFAILAVPFVARDLTQVLERVAPPRRLGSPWARAAWTAILCVAGSIAAATDPLVPMGLGMVPQFHPTAACDFIQRHAVRGRSFNHYEFGGYLLWRFHPQPGRLPFMDIHQTGSTEDRRLAALSLLQNDAWEALDRRYRFDWVIFDRYHPGEDRSCDILDADSAFALVFVDDVAALYVRRDGPMREVAERFGYRLLRAGNESAAAIAAAGADSTRRPALLAELDRLAAESPFHATALSLEANLFYREGRLAEARDALRGARAIQPDFPLVDDRLADVAMRLDRPVEALAAAERAVRTEGHNPRLDDLRFAAHARERELSAARRALATGSPGGLGRDSLAAIERALAPEPPLPRADLPDEWHR